MAPSPQPSAALTAATRAEEWAGEVRVNLFRLIAIGGFYANHMVDYYWLRIQFPQTYHLVVSGIAAAWAIGAWVLYLCLARRWNPPYLKYGAVAWDALMTTSLLAFSGGPRSPFIALLFLIVATTPLRLRLRVVWVATILSILSYAFVCGQSQWVRPEWRASTREHGIMVIALAGAGALAGQGIRQARRFALDLVDRVRPEETAGDEERTGPV